MLSRAGFAALILGMWLTGPSAAAGVQIDIPPDLPSEQQARIREFASRITGMLGEKGNGHDLVRVTSQSELLASVSSGKAQLALIPTRALTESVPDFSVYDSLFGFQSYYAVEAFQSGEKGQRLLASLSKTKLTGLSYWHSGFVQLASNRPSKSLNDILGQKTAVAGLPESLTSRQFAELGTEPLQLRAPSDGLKAGVVDFAETTWKQLALEKSVGKPSEPVNVLETNHRYRGYVLVANSDYWNSLSSNQKDFAKTFAADLAKQGNKVVAASDLAARSQVFKYASVSTTDFAEKRAVVSKLAFAGMVPNLAWEAWESEAARSGPYPLPRGYKPAVLNATGGPTTVVGAKWNGWFERDGEAKDFIIASLKYDAVLDLSRYAYREGVGVPTSSELQNELTRAATQNKPLRLLIRSIPVAGELKYTTGAVTERVVAVDIKKLSTQKDAEFKQRRGDGVADSSKITELSQTFSALLADGKQTFRVPVSAAVSGCAQIAFSIWDYDDARPIDHVVLTVPVAADVNTKPPKCGVPAMQGGFGSLASAVGSGGVSEIDAALNVFEFSGGPFTLRTVAVYVDFTKLRRPTADSSEPAIHSWELQTSLSDYLGSSLLLNTLSIAWNTGNYTALASDLSAKLFPLSSGNSQDPPASALRSLENLAAPSGRKPNVIVRSVRADGRHLYIPLGLLEASGRFKTAPAYIYPLPRASYSTSACIRRWTLGYPNQLSTGEGAPSELALDEATTFLPDQRTKRLGTFSELRCYLNPGASDCQTETTGSAPVDSEGLLLLAHQGDGALWYTYQPNLQWPKVPIEGNQRKFQAGSIAFITACSVANPNGDNQKVLERLNRNGIDAMVVSPFPVEVKYGGYLARAAIDVIKKAFDDKQTPTLQKLFEDAADKVAAEHPDDRFKQRRFEFLLLGNHQIRLCN